MGKPKSQRTNKTAAKISTEPTLMTFMGHVRELRRRLFWSAVWLVVLSGAIFPFYKQIIQILMKPLGNEKLYFLSPVGGLGFAMKICMYVGLIAVLPILVYNLYKFISPIIPHHRARTAIAYICLSALLAMCGVAFAYTVSLPSALHFLTHFDIGNVSAMLTVDAYLSFIVAYVLAGALLFQLPLIMVIIDSITPTPPSGWNKYQRHMIVAAFVIAMLITPVPDILNQFILAMPIVVMYQVGILLIWMRHRTKNAKAAKSAIANTSTTKVQMPTLQVVQPVAAAPVVSLTNTAQSVTVQEVAPVQVARRRSIDGLSRPSRTLSVPARPGSSSANPGPLAAKPRPTIDGIFAA